MSNVVIGDLNYCSSPKIPPNDKLRLVFVNYGYKPLMYDEYTDHFNSNITYPIGFSHIVRIDEIQLIELQNDSKDFYGGCMFKYNNDYIHYTWFYDFVFKESNFCITLNDRFLLFDVYVDRNFTIYYEIYIDS